MKRLLLPTLLLLGGLSIAEQWTDHKGLTMTFRDLKALASGKIERNVSMVGDVKVESTPQGLRMTSDTMDIHAVPDSKNTKSYVIQHALATGHVVILKEVAGKAGKQTTRIEGTKADYATGLTESMVKMAGPVKMQSLDSQHAQTMVATGNSGVATLEPLNKTNLDSGLKTAAIDGSAHLALTQIDPKTHAASTIRTTSDHMVLENQPMGQKITLTGHVHITSDSDFDWTGIDRVVFFVDKDGNVKIGEK